MSAKSGSVDIQAFLNEHPFSAYQWVIFALCFCIVLLDGFDTAAIGYIAPSLMSEWGVDRPSRGETFTVTRVCEGGGRARPHAQVLAGFRCAAW